jgi:hypothetical protein
MEGVQSACSKDRPQIGEDGDQLSETRGWWERAGDGLAIGSEVSGQSSARGGGQREQVRLYLSGVDLVDGTPVLDIKPYLPRYDSLPSAVVAPWVDDPKTTLQISESRPHQQSEEQRHEEEGAGQGGLSLIAIESVTWIAEAEAELSRLVSEGHLQFYGREEAAMVRQAIGEVLVQDIRSLHQKKTYFSVPLIEQGGGRPGVGETPKPYRLRFDRLEVGFYYPSQTSICVQSVHLWRQPEDEQSDS